MNHNISSVLEEDLNDICAARLPWKKLSGANVLITGATGLIGGTLVRALHHANITLHLSLKVYAIVRSIEKARTMFPEMIGAEDILFLEGSMEELPQLPLRIDYVVHGACPTTSSFMVAHPVQVIRTSVFGTASLLDAANSRMCRGFVFLSSMEAYGTLRQETDLTEDILGTIDLANIRSCYPESKRMCEMLCTSYAAEFGMRAMSIRLAQTFGPGVMYDDNRVFAMMARCAIEEKDIILATKGTSRRPYLYTAQAITAILTVLLQGEAGMTYNAANPSTYCSVFEMGQLVADHLAHGKISVRVDETADVSRYPAASYLKLNADRLRALGWEPRGDLVWMYERLIRSMIEKRH